MTCNTCKPVPEGTGVVCLSLPESAPSVLFSGEEAVHARPSPAAAAKPVAVGGVGSRSGACGLWHLLPHMRTTHSAYSEGSFETHAYVYAHGVHMVWRRSPVT